MRQYYLIANDDTLAFDSNLSNQFSAFKASD